MAAKGKTEAKAKAPAMKGPAIPAEKTAKGMPAAKGKGGKGKGC